MSIPTYTPGYPPDGSSLGQTKAVIRNNLDGTFDTVGVDHINNNGEPGSQPAGYHNIIHAVPQGSDPAAVTGYGQLYSKTVNSYTNDQALFWETGAGLIQQLTSNITPSATLNGYTFLPGGLILQWGTKTSAGSGGVVTFPTPFQTAVFSILTTVIANSGGFFVTIKNTPAPIITKFNYDSTTSTPAFYWFAIGV